MVIYLPLHAEFGPNDHGEDASYFSFQYLGEPCTNIDECALNTHNCTIDRSTCQDTEGTYFCPCKLGWVSDVEQAGFKIFSFFEMYSLQTKSREMEFQLNGIPMN